MKKRNKFYRTPNGVVVVVVVKINKNCFITSVIICPSNRKVNTAVGVPTGYGDTAYFHIGNWRLCFKNNKFHRKKRGM